LKIIELTIEEIEMTVINTNIAANITANAMKSNQRVMENTMERLATGLRVNSASDDAAGLAIGAKMEAQIRGLNQAIRNANDGISMVQTADGAAIEIGEMLQRMRELSVQAQNGTNSTNDLTNLNKEFASLATEIDRVADDATFNGKTVLKGLGNQTFNVGADASDDLTVAFADFNLAAGGASASAATFTSVITVANLQAMTDNSDIEITDGDGNVLTVTEANLITAGATNSNTFTTPATATIADLVLAINTAIGTNSGFAQMTASAVAADGGILFTQQAATVGSITGVSTSLSGVSSALGTGTSSTTPSTGATGVMGADLTSYKTAGSIAQASGTIAALDLAIQGVSAARSDFGAAVNTLEYSVDNLNNAVQNTMAAKSAIMDADYAAETTELARTQIISQASTAMLSQANQQAQSVLALLK
jgi:flagellin